MEGKTGRQERRQREDWKRVRVHTPAADGKALRCAELAGRADVAEEKGGGVERVVAYISDAQCTGVQRLRFNADDDT